MALLFGRKWPRYILVTYLIPAMMGTSIFSMAESLDLSAYTAHQTALGGFFTPIDHAIDWLIEDTATISKAGEYPSSPPRGGFPRMFTPPGTQNTGMVLVQSSPRTIIQTQYFNVKNIIPLKLRI